MVGEWGSSFEGFEQAGEFRREFGGEGEFFLVGGAADGEFCSMQEVSFEGETFFTTAVYGIAHDRITNIGEMDADLVRASGIEAAFDQGVVLVEGQRAVCCLGGAGPG